jgi:hypothetical protein
VDDEKGEGPMDQKREGGQMLEDEEGPKGASLISRPGGEQVARGRMAQRVTWKERRGPTWLNIGR